MHDNKKTAVALIGSGHVNAVGIAMSLREVGWTGRIICAAPPGSVSELYPEICETIHARWTESADLVDYATQFATQGAAVHLFLTDEALLDDIEAQQDALSAANVSLYPRIKNSWELVTDRKKFYDFVCSRGLAEVPQHVCHSINPWEVFPNGFRARVWKSWNRGRKLSRGMNVMNVEDFQRWLRVVHSEDLRPSEWAFQKLLSCEPRDNVSVCGWHDQDEQLYFVTRKLVQKQDIGAIVECVSACGDLLGTARKILVALGFEGAFELEFLRDPSDDRFKVLELNPRFWMQHRLIAKLTDNALVRRHLGFELENKRKKTSQRGIWIDPTSIYLLLRITPLFHILRNWPFVFFAVPITPLVRNQALQWLAFLLVRCRARFRNGLRRILRQPL